MWALAWKGTLALPAKACEWPTKAAAARQKARDSLRIIVLLLGKTA
jgi:hypothetical protein